MSVDKSENEAWHYLSDERATSALGALLANQLTWPAVVFLHGPLGAGKTALVRAMLRDMGYSGLVKSPTYTLVEEYLQDPLRVIHFDLYRLSDPEELEYMGIRDYFASRALCLLEWPERGQGVLPSPELEVWLQIVGASRRVRLIAHGSRMAQAVAAIEKQLV